MFSQIVSGRVYFRSGVLVWVIKPLVKKLLDCKVGGTISLLKGLHFGRQGTDDSMGGSSSQDEN